MERGRCVKESRAGLGQGQGGRRTVTLELPGSLPVPLLSSFLHFFG